MKKLIGKCLCYWFGHKEEKVIWHKVDYQMEQPSKTYPRGSFLYDVVIECTRCGLRTKTKRTGCPDCIDTGVRH